MSTVERGRWPHPEAITTQAACREVYIAAEDWETRWRSCMAEVAVQERAGNTQGAVKALQEAEGIDFRIQLLMRSARMVDACEGQEETVRKGAQKIRRQAREAAR